MKSLKLTPQWDLSVDENGNIAMVDGGLRIAQDVATSCRVWKGECLLNTERGIPYKEEIMGLQPNMSVLQAYASQEGTRIDGAEIITIKDVTFENRVLKPDIQITTNTGESL